MTFVEANSTTSEVASAKLQPEFAKKVLTPAQKKLHNFSFGETGEKAATRYLSNLGYQILHTNLQIGKYELDIVALDEKYKELVFVEVKTRKVDTLGHPSQAVKSKKLRSMACAARGFVRKYPTELDYRFDIIAITGEKIEHFENVSWNY